MLNKLKAFTELLGKGIANGDKIVKGIINNVQFNNGSLPEDEQEEIVKRRVICMTCPYNSTNAKTSEQYKALHNGQTYKEETGRGDLHCSLCACNIHWKTAVMDEKCGLTYYNDTHPENIQELKWKEKIKTDVQQITTEQFREGENSNEGAGSI